MPEIFHSSEAFDEWFNLSDNDDDDAKQQLVQQLHKILKPFMLRRLKMDVEKELVSIQCDAVVAVVFVRVDFISSFLFYCLFLKA